jgi:pilus assembly protein Flp/PilA
LNLAGDSASTRVETKDLEYAVMLSLIIVVCITAISAPGSNANNTFSYVGTQVGNAGVS